MVGRGSVAAPGQEGCRVLAVIGGLWAVSLGIGGVDRESGQPSSVARVEQLQGWRMRSLWMRVRGWSHVVHDAVKHSRTQTQGRSMGRGASWRCMQRNVSSRS